MMTQEEKAQKTKEIRSQLIGMAVIKTLAAGGEVHLHYSKEQ